MDIIESGDGAGGDRDDPREECSPGPGPSLVLPVAIHCLVSHPYREAIESVGEFSRNQRVRRSYNLQFNSIPPQKPCVFRGLAPARSGTIPPKGPYGLGGSLTSLQE